jgi:hypothetical protein
MMLVRISLARLNPELRTLKCFNCDGVDRSSSLRLRAALFEASKQGLLNGRLNASASIPIDWPSRRWRDPSLLQPIAVDSVVSLGNISRLQAVSVVARFVLQMEIVPSWIDSLTENNSKGSWNSAADSW